MKYITIKWKCMTVLWIKTSSLQTEQGFIQLCDSYDKQVLCGTRMIDHEV